MPAASMNVTGVSDGNSNARARPSQRRASGMACGLVAASESGASGKDESRALHHVVTLDCKPSTAAMAVQTGPASCT